MMWLADGENFFEDFVYLTEYTNVTDRHHTSAYAALNHIMVQQKLIKHRPQLSNVL